MCKTSLSLQYSVCIGTILLVEIVSVLVTFLYRDSLSQALKEGIYFSMEKYGMNTERSQAVDLLQAGVGCCGVSGPQDWHHTSWGRGHSHRLPHSCCLSTTTGICDSQPQHGTVLHQRGCHQEITDLVEDYAFHLISFFLLSSFVHFLAVSSSCCLGRMKGDYQAIT